MGFVFAVVDLLFSLICSVHRFNKLWVFSQPIKIGKLVLKHVILSLLFGNDITLPHLHRQVGECGENRNGTQQFGDSP